MMLLVDTVSVVAYQYHYVLLYIYLIKIQVLWELIGKINMSIKESNEQIKRHKYEWINWFSKVTQLNRALNIKKVPMQ